MPSIFDFKHLFPWEYLKIDSGSSIVSNFEMAVPMNVKVPNSQHSVNSLFLFTLLCDQ